MPIAALLRLLHRNIGFLTIGITLVYALSGVALIYRDTDFLKFRESVAITVAPNLQAEEIAALLHARRLKVTQNWATFFNFEDEGTIENGQYERKTGALRYTKMELPFFLQHFIRFHRIHSATNAHWFATLYGTLLLFLALSSLGFYKPGTRPFYKGIGLTVLGAVMTAVVLGGI